MVGELLGATVNEPALQRCDELLGIVRHADDERQAYADSGSRVRAQCFAGCSLAVRIVELNKLQSCRPQTGHSPTRMHPAHRFPLRCPGPELALETRPLAGV